MHTLTLQLGNMHCGACVRRVSQTLNSMPSTHAEEVRVGMVRVRTEQPPAELYAALARVGFPVQSGAATE